VTLELSDTAGLRETEDSVESIGVKRAEAEMEKAELLIGVFDSSVPLAESEKAMISKYPVDCARIAVIKIFMVREDLTIWMSISCLPSSVLLPKVRRPERLKTCCVDVAKRP
jgi:tRNA U34 5-carboxymethylaminomethyl modifying GTPase MnmE/TrmE